MYGGWITPTGEIIDCPDKCSHTKYCDYGDAHDEGWVCFTYSSAVYDMRSETSFGMSIRLNPVTVPPEALRSLLKLIRQSGEDDFFISDMFTGSFEGYYQGCSRHKITDALRRLRAGEDKVFWNDRMELFNMRVERGK